MTNIKVRNRGVGRPQSKYYAYIPSSEDIINTGREEVAFLLHCGFFIPSHLGRA